MVPFPSASPTSTPDPSALPTATPLTTPRPTASPADHNSLGVFSLGVPQAGLGSGKFVLFSHGRIFTGTMTGEADPTRGKIEAVLGGGAPTATPGPIPSTTVIPGLTPSVSIIPGTSPSITASATTVPSIVPGSPPSITASPTTVPSIVPGTSPSATIIPGTTPQVIYIPGSPTPTPTPANVTGRLTASAFNTTTAPFQSVGVKLRGHAHLEYNEGVLSSDGLGVTAVRTERMRVRGFKQTSNVVASGSASATPAPSVAATATTSP